MPSRHLNARKTIAVAPTATMLIFIYSLFPSSSVIKNIAIGVIIKKPRTSHSSAYATTIASPASAFCIPRFFKLIVGADFLFASDVFKFVNNKSTQNIKSAMASTRGKNSGPTGTFLNCLKVRVYPNAAAETIMPITADMILAFFTRTSAD